jgi:hypothetical protein
MTKKNSELSGDRSLLNVSIKDFISKYSYRIDLDADYQREKIWSGKQQELLLDSIIKDIDIPKIYIVKVEGNKQFDFECIDGKQRMSSFLKFFRPEDDDLLMLRFLEKKYTYKKLKKFHPSIAKKIEDYELSFTIYEPIDDEYVREIFRRLQLGIRLNSGELLKTRTGTIRDFIYKDIGNNGPFFRNTNLSEKRFSRPFTLAQICLNSFGKAASGDFVRARLLDIEDFFDDNHDISRNNENLERIRTVLRKMDKIFGKDAFNISSRAIAISGYLYFEELFVLEELSLLSKFAKFYIKLIDAIKYNMVLISKYEKPNNTKLMEEFQKYILQASVEGYSIRRRHEFLKKAFDYYLSNSDKIIGSK